MKISYSAPAKTILSGEHAVVYGKPALITTLNLRLTFTLWEADKKITDKVIGVITKTVTDYLTKKKISFVDKPFEYQIDSQIPRGQHLGSSAALSVASAAAFLEFYTGKKFSKDVINIVAYDIEKYFHGNPSGGDNSASCFGGLIYFRKEFEFLKNISALHIKLPKTINDALYIIDSGTSEENTLEMVKAVGELYNKNPHKTEDILNKIEKTTKRMVVAIMQENRAFFSASIIENEQLLEELNVVSQTTKKLLADLKKFGAGKITGAGGYQKGSGNLLFFTEKPTELEAYLKIHNISFIKFKQDFEGVRKEKR